MPTDRERLLTIKGNLLDLIDEITAEPKPNYSIDGQSVSWQSYLDSLWAKVKEINEEINASDPFEIVSRGTSLE